ncbi:MAG: hypothetical protein RIC56_16610 [Pseudomonadales bacterium]
MNNSIRSWAWRLGLHPAPPGRGLLVLADADDPTLRGVLQRVRDDHPRVNLFHLQTPGCPALPDTIAVPGPAPFGCIQRRFLRRLKVQATLVSSNTHSAGALLDTAAALGIEVLTVGAASCADSACRRLRPLLATPRPPAKAGPGIEAWLLARVDRAPLAWVTSRKFRAVDSLAAVAEELGRPRTILCLGNGPSSRDPALDGLAYDALFRVNHLWLDDHRHTAPDVIFTGKKDTLSAYRRPTLFAFQTEQAARRIMLRAVLLPRRIRYCTAERLGCIDFAAFAPYKPTNGAVMIALAAALAPQRLIVAGMDLFSDPRGSYPGQSATPNAYAAAHDRDVEARCILATLAAFPGELSIVGDVLKARWAEHQTEAQAPGDPPHH